VGFRLIRGDFPVIYGTPLIIKIILKIKALDCHDIVMPYMDAASIVKN